MTRLVVSEMIINNTLALKHADPCECALNYKVRLATRKVWCFAILACYAQTDDSGFDNVRTPHSRLSHLRREVIGNSASCCSTSATIPSEVAMVAEDKNRLFLG